MSDTEPTTPHTLHAPVCLVSMPFGAIDRPSIGLSSVQAALRQQEITADILYLNLMFAEGIGASLYHQISDGQPAYEDLIGEWLFAAAVFGRDQIDTEGFLDQVVRGRNPVHAKPPALVNATQLEDIITELRRVQGEIEPFLDTCVSMIAERGPQVVGFTSTFQQQLASLALAKRLKEQHPDITTVFGGANVEGIMGATVVETFPWVDVVVSGEGEVIFPQVVAALQAGQSIAGFRGVFTRASVQTLITSYPSAPSPRVMDDLPVPSFVDFFSQRALCPDTTSITACVPFETSRGCWWGRSITARSAASMVARLHSVARVPTEHLLKLSDLVATYPGLTVAVVDNILDMAYFKTFLPMLAQAQLGVSLFFETKANLPA